MDNNTDPFHVSYYSLEEYSQLLKISKYELDEELVAQPSVFYRVGEAYSDALSYRDQAKNNLEVTKARLDKEIRQYAITNLTKVTESQVANLVQEAPDYQQSQQTYLDWKVLVEKWSALRDSFKDRGYALRDLVQLHIAGYYMDSLGKAERIEARDRVANSVRGMEAEERRKRRV